jgi:HAD superfamily hydrolase (TIGR01458 family)
MAGVLFDLDGVFYVGGEAVEGAAMALDWFRRRDIPYLFLTNTTTRPRSALVEKLRGFGIETDAEHILTPPVAARRWIQDHAQGRSALFVPEATRAEFDGLDLAGPDAQPPLAAVVVGDLGEEWDFATYNAVFRLLMSEPRPALVALGMTRYWRAPDGLRLDVGAYVSGLEYACGINAVVMGKPAGAFFHTALDIIGCKADGTIMIGDDIRTDVGGAQAAGIDGVLVRTGKFREEDLDRDIQPVAVLDSVADLPAWWERRSGP